MQDTIIRRGHAFISYIREDARQVDRLQRALEEVGVQVWRDSKNLWPGEDWRTKIRSAIADDAIVFIVCFSRQSLAREKSYQNEELNLAIEQLRLRRPGVSWLIPIRFDECSIPDHDIGGGRTLSSIQCADLFGDYREDALLRLVAAVLRILEPGERSSSSRTQMGPSETRDYLTTRSRVSSGDLRVVGLVELTKKTAGWFRRPEWLKAKYVIFSALALAFVAVISYILSNVLTAGAGDRAAALSAKHAAHSSPAEPHNTRSYRLRTLADWATHVEASCKKMSPALNRDLAEMKTILRSGSLERTPISARIPRVLSQYYSDYAKIATQVQDVLPSSYPVTAVHQWLNLFNNRGQSLYAAVQSIEAINGDPFERISASYNLDQYASQSNAILPLARQLGVKSCP